MSWNVDYIVLILFSTVIDYVCGLQIDKSKSALGRKLFLSLSLVTNLGLLFTFKYFNFFSSSISYFLQQFAIPLQPLTLKLVLPVGISFYTFQTLSYTIDVFRKKIKPENTLVSLLSMFPFSPN